MKVKVFEDYYVSDLEKDVNSFLATISEEQIKHIRMSGSGERHTTIAIFYTEK
ncbi:MAG: sporulation protein Cse60 [Bacteroidaceae bacterium]|nr:sporulation protein Cse60 [Bacteroidaceae bacterium]